MMKLSNLQKRLAESNTYQPAEDTFFLADHIENEKGEIALDIGTGSGFLAKILSNSFSLVIGTDINVNSLRKLSTPIGYRICCKAADVFSNKFDFIICNFTSIVLSSGYFYLFYFFFSFNRGFYIFISLHEFSDDL